jgi:uncharacterized membrane protein HdeD (DUF308 family)
MLAAIREKHRRALWAFVVRGVLAIAVGILMLSRPLDSLAALALIVAIWALITGVTEIVHALHIRSASSSWWVLLLGGVISIGFGATALYYYPELSLAFMTAWVGLWLMMSGAFGIYSSIHMRRSGLPWVWSGVWGVVSVLGSLIAFANPPATLVAILGLLAVFAIFSGTTLLVAAWRIGSISRRIPAVVPPT